MICSDLHGHQISAKLNLCFDQHIRKYDNVQNFKLLLYHSKITASVRHYVDFPFQLASLSIFFFTCK